MQGGVLLNKDDIKRIIAEHFDVPIECVVPTKYNYMVIGIDEDAVDTKK